MTVKLLKGDCLKLLPDIPDESVDLILADLPYGTTNSRWDSALPADKLWEQYNRVITPKGAIVLFSSGSFTNKLINSQSDHYRYKWIWLKNRKANFVNAKNRPLSTYEEVLVFSHGITANTRRLERKMNYFPQGLKPTNIVHRDAPDKFDSLIGVRPSHHTTVQKWTGYPCDLLQFDVVKKKLHTNQKPVKLLEYLIKTYTNEGMTVLDNVMGSGSTGVAAVNLKRNFIGMELDDNYFKIAKKRIEKADRSTLAG